jgi:hypothetical protein
VSDHYLAHAKKGHETVTISKKNKYYSLEEQSLPEQQISSAHPACLFPV